MANNLFSKFQPRRSKRNTEGRIKLPYTGNPYLKTDRGLEDAKGETFSGSPSILAQAIRGRAIDKQTASPLFSVIPNELRNRIFSLALSSHYNTDKPPYAPDGYVSRPGYRYEHRIDTNLLLTCRLIYLETHLLPLSSNEHIFWLERGPENSLSNGNASYRNPRPASFLNKLTKEQVDAVEKIRLFTQMYWLEGRFPSLCAQKYFRPKMLKITIRHSDWWYWEQNNPLRLQSEKWLPSLGQVDRLEEFIIELETMERDKGQLERIVKAVEQWKIDRQDRVQLTANEKPIWEKWNGPLAFTGLKYQKQMNRWAPDGGYDASLPEICEGMVYWVATVRFVAQRRYGDED